MSRCTHWDISVQKVSCCLRPFPWLSYPGEFHNLDWRGLDALGEIHCSLTSSCHYSRWHRAGFWNEHEMHPHLFSLFKFACIAVPLLFQVPYIYRAYGDYYWRLSRGLESRAALGLWMSKNLNENFTIAYGDAGMLAYKSMLPLLDMNGLVDKRIAQIRHNYFSQNIRDSIEAQYIVDRRPSMIILVTRDHPDKIWFPVDYGKELVNNSSFHTYFQQAGYLIAYPPKKVPAYPTGRFLVFFARRDVLISGFQRILCCINQAISTDQDPQQACLSSSAEQ